MTENFCMGVSIIAAVIAIAAAASCAVLHQWTEKLGEQIFNARQKQISNLNKKARSIK